MARHVFAVCSSCKRFWFTLRLRWHLARAAAAVLIRRELLLGFVERKGEISENVPVTQDQKRWFPTGVPVPTVSRLLPTSSTPGHHLLNLAFRKF